MSLLGDPTGRGHWGSTAPPVPQGLSNVTAVPVSAAGNGDRMGQEKGTCWRESSAWQLSLAATARITLPVLYRH